MKRFFLILLLFCCWANIHAQIARSSGLVFYGGKGSTRYDTAPLAPDLPPFDPRGTYFDSKYTVGMGYRWRLNRPGSRWFVDLALSARYSRYEYGFQYQSDGHEFYAGGMGAHNMLAVSFAGSAGYYLYKGLNLSVGVEPSYYLCDRRFFDFPAFVKLGYDFGFMEFAVVYKVGLTRKFAAVPYRNIGLSQWECSLYVPLFRRK